MKKENKYLSIALIPVIISLIFVLFDAFINFRGMFYFIVGIGFSVIWVSYWVYKSAYD